MTSRRTIGAARVLLRQAITSGKSHFLPLYTPGEANLFFREGWGDSGLLRALTQHSWIEFPMSPGIDWVKRNSSLCPVSFDGTFPSPLSHLLEGPNQTVRCRMYSPTSLDKMPSLVLICAMTGDEGYRQRIRRYTKKLLSRGIGVVLLENPFYGARKTKAEPSIFISSVSAMLALCVASAEESRYVLSHLRGLGLTKLAVAGVSQGGMVACAAGALTTFPIAIVASLAAHSPHIIFSRGLLRAFTDWKRISGNDSLVATVRRLRETFSIGDITRLPVPKKTQAAILQAGRLDPVVPIPSVRRIHENWPGSEFKVLPGTHLSSILLHSNSFCRSIEDALGRL